MSPEAWIALVCGSLTAIPATVAWLLARRDAKRAKGKHGNAMIYLECATAERDAALKSKSEQFEAWQAEATNLRRDVAALEKRLGAAQRENADLRSTSETHRMIAVALCGSYERLFPLVGLSTDDLENNDPEGMEAMLTRKIEELQMECRDATDLGIVAQREAEAAQRELALLRPIAAAAHKFMDDDKLPGEWREVREALKPWAEREGKS